MKRQRLRYGNRRKDFAAFPQQPRKEFAAFSQEPPVVEPIAAPPVAGKPQSTTPSIARGLVAMIGSWPADDAEFDQPSDPRPREMPVAPPVAPPVAVDESDESEKQPAETRRPLISAEQRSLGELFADFWTLCFCGVVLVAGLGMLGAGPKAGLWVFAWFQLGVWGIIGIVLSRIYAVLSRRKAE